MLTLATMRSLVMIGVIASLLGSRTKSSHADELRPQGARRVSRSRGGLGVGEGGV
jgi:hypothetical protein